MRLKFFEGPIQKQVNDPAEFKKPISLEQLQDVVGEGMKPLEKADPKSASVINQAIVTNVVAVMKEGKGEFTLQGLESFNDGNNLAQSGVAQMLSSKARDEGVQDMLKATQIGTAALVKLLVDWVNKGRPEIQSDEKVPLSISKIREAVAKEVAKPEDREYIDKLLGAFETKNPSGTMTMRQLRGFHDEINAAKEALTEKIDARETAGLSPDKALDDQSHALVVQSLGAYRLSDMLTYSADQGELAKLAADVKPGAAQSLGGAV